LTCSSFEQINSQFSFSVFINDPLIRTPPKLSISLQNQFYKVIIVTETLLGAVSNLACVIFNQIAWALLF